MDTMDGGYSRSRAGSFSGDYRGRSSSPYGGVPFPGGVGGSSYGDPYAYDQSIMHPHHRSRSHSRSRRHSSSSRRPTIIVPPPPANQYGAGYGSAPMPIPGTVPSSSYGTYGSYGGYPSSPYGQPIASPVPGYSGGGLSPYGGGYTGSNVQPGAVIIPSSSRRHRHSISGSHHHHHHHRPRSTDGYGGYSGSYRY
jgi:hypothetical protein